MKANSSIPLSPESRHLVAAVRALRSPGLSLTLDHWLLVLLGQHRGLVEQMTQEIHPEALLPLLQRRLQQGHNGPQLSEEEVVAEAECIAQARNMAQIEVRDLCAVILTRAGYELEEPVPLPQNASWEQPFCPLLERYGRDLTRAAREGRLSAVVGREEEIQMVIETLCRRTKRNPALIGPAGVGKTAIVEGLAQYIARGDVPPLLQNAHLWAIEPASLLAGTHVHGEFEERVQALLAEARRTGVLLFIDEMHTIVRAAGGGSDLANLLKPALASGEIACIAATTDDEYRRFIEADPALERRFQPIRVQEPTLAQTRAILEALRDELQRLRGVNVSNGVLQQILEVANTCLRNRCFPDKGVDLLEQCVAHALAKGQTEVRESDVAEITRRMTGVLLTPAERIARLKQVLQERPLMLPSDAEALVHRLSVSLRGLDTHPERPNATLLLIGEMSHMARPLAEAIAEAVYGDAARLVDIDLAGMREAHDISQFIGSPPGYVGYESRLPIHQIAQLGSCVFLCRNIESCHKSLRSLLAQAIATGLLTDSCGKRIFLSDTITLLSADVNPEQLRRMGLVGGHTKQTPDPRELAESVLEPDLVEQMDEVCMRAPSPMEREALLTTPCLQTLIQRYHAQGIELKWDATALEWLLQRQQHAAHPRDWEREVDEQLGAILEPYLPDVPGESAPLTVTIFQHDNALQARVA
ncbi:MAG TPA: AAA family ATPase [Chthonomonas sp.]|uniref:AAA family ATPase n=1 Tax=Chthonomonas sp. TaxID=2282153 RepID=UPI002B4B33A8|nr:AAA family ATPase [Chthonomonas sp.]HLH79249.1 AAA family ATPase [Chthonomonas sp.]